MRAVGTPTAGSLVNLVLNEEVDHGDDGGKESKRDCEGLTIYLEPSRRTL